MEELRASISRTATQLPERERETTKGVARETLMLARSNYEVQFAQESSLSERVLFPVTPSRATDRGCPLCPLNNEDGTRTYYATYTAYDGKISCPIPRDIRFSSLQIHHVEWPGRREQGHGALSPKINGLYAMLGRQTLRIST